ncbi:MAG: flavodoxin [Bacteroidales bacterium]|nr:flavodoxin [Bacteroidales bacterium]
MKRVRNILWAVLTIFAATACSQNKSTNNMDQNVLVVYFSATGTTRHAAEQLANVTGADLCEIVPAQPYSRADLDWNDKQSRSSIEMANPQARPEIEPLGLDLKKYDRIFLGYPIWCDLAPRAVYTFIEKVDLTGKTVIPFATSGGSGIAGSVSDLKKAYPETKWQDGRLLNRADEKSIKAWLDKIEY